MNENVRLRPGSLLLALLLACLFFAGLYHYDNKYTSSGVQPISGLLILNEDELNAHPLHFLTREWEFYPGALLSPADFADKTPDAFRQYVSIGEQGGLSGGIRGLSRHGNGTYRLRLSLPIAPRLYALELPEVFSACRLYVNDDELLSLGTLQPFRSGIQSRIVPFYGGGEMMLLLNVADQSAYYSGLTYPPAFGEVSAVSNMRDARLFLRVVVLLIALLCALLALWLAVRLHWPYGCPLTALCICFVISAGHPLLHAWFLTGVQPWYTIETACFYSIVTLAIVLQNRICGLHGRIPRIAVWFGVAFCAVSVVYTLAMPQLGDHAATIFSGGSAIYKYAAALYLFLTAIRLRHEKEIGSAGLLITSFIFAASLTVDRLLPYFEPIRGGFFIEIGTAVLVLGLAFILLAQLFDAYRFRLSFAAELRQMQRQLAFEKEHARRLGEQIEATRAARHDLRHHVHALQQLTARSAYDEVRAYLNQLDPIGADSSPLTYTAHPVADAVLQHYAARGKQAGAALDFALDLPPTIALPDDELCVLLANLLENAAEAVERQNDGERFLYLRGQLTEDRLSLLIENSFDGHVRQTGERFYSLKHTEPGIGIQSVRTIVAQHGGLIDFTSKNLVFRVSILLPLAK